MSTYRVKLSASTSSSPVYLSSDNGETDILDFFSSGNQVADTSKASIPLIRSGARDYADELSEAMIHILENFADHEAPANPIKGQLWYKADTQQLRICLGVRPTVWGYIYTSSNTINAAPTTINLSGDIDQTLDHTFVLNPITNAINVAVNLSKTLAVGHSASTVYNYPQIRVGRDGRIVSITNGTAPAQGVPWASATNNRVTVDRDLNTTGKIMEGGNPLLPAGAIIMWHGTTVPNGWAECNGQNGTPDLRDRFVVGASSGKPVNSTGGSSSLTGNVTTSAAGGHTHNITGGNHSHGTTGGHALTIDQIPRHQHATNWGESNNHAYPKYGANGTLRNNIGSRDTDYDNFEYMSSWVGGDQPHSHTIPDGGSHSHTVSSVADHTHSVNISGNVTPPYYALRYIMKL